MVLFDSSVVLFESDDGDEALRVECAITADGGLVILQESAGPITAWCFDESPHRLEMEVGRAGVRELMDYFHMESARQIPLVLRLEYAGYDCCQRMRKLMERLGIRCEVIEGAACSEPFWQLCERFDFSA